MTDKEDKDVVVNLFKNANPKIMSKDLAAQTPKEEYQKMVLDSLETIKKDIDALKATGMITILMDDEIFESRYTNQDGLVRLPINSMETGEVLVTVTKKNHYPYTSSFQLYDSGVAVGPSYTPF